MNRSYHFSGYLMPFLGLLVLGGQARPALAAEASAAVTQPTSEGKSSLKVVEIPVEGMACISCAASVKSAVKALSGVVAVEVSLEKRNARVTYLPSELTPDRILAAIDKLGYSAGTPRDVP